MQFAAPPQHMRFHLYAPGRPSLFVDIRAYSYTPPSRGTTTTLRRFRCRPSTHRWRPCRATIPILLRRLLAKPAARVGIARPGRRSGRFRAATSSSAARATSAASRVRAAPAGFPRLSEA
ncbi:uncharacterized protein LOC125515901 [Triticum urartu]|uniref:uncharacterized protein LOC125515901 n=1 Tax=Triticum urartu TaxID=4572 RepID=UPI002042C551|nr:uncharacterized protein LOC125515901 [Triticum urartu]